MAYKSVSSWRVSDFDNYGRNSGFQFKSLCKATVTVVIVGVGIKITMKLINYLKKKKRLEYSLRKPDVVILHQFPRSATVPNLSPFVLKLETYLRLANISYENDFKDPMGPKGKCPYITLNGEDICDSQLAIEYLNKLCNIDLDSNLSETDRAVSHALRVMLENNLYWAAAYYRWVLEDSKVAIKQLVAFSFPWDHCIYNYIRRGVKTAIWYQGIGRHSKYEIMAMLHKDMKSLSVFLGEKKFLFGEKPTEVDCSVFGMLAQIMWTLPGTALEEYLKSDCPNLRQYCLRMKTEVWPDWDQCLYPKK